MPSPCPIRQHPISPCPKSDSKDNPAEVAKDGYAELLEGDAQTVSGLMNKIRDAFAGIIPDTVLAQMHRKMAQPVS